jgi:hypothetical protein
MSALDNTPDNKNFLSPLNFKFQIKKCPHVNFFVQKVGIPQIALPPVMFPNPMVKAPMPGDHMTYGDFTVTFKVDEDLQNYLEIHNWIKALGKPVDFTERKAIRETKDYTGEGEKSDISLMVLSSTFAANYEVILTDAFPVSLSGIEFNTMDTDVVYLNSTATFKYTYYDINRA